MNLSHLWDRPGRGLLKSRQGRPGLAHRFNGGLLNEMEKVPSGTKEWSLREPQPKIVGIERMRLNSAGFRKEKPRKVALAFFRRGNGGTAYLQRA